MPELQPPPPTHDRPAAAPNAAAPDADAPDALAQLHKMSTTAGLGTTEYVAINAPSVIAVILGLASALAIVDKILLIVPLTGVICAAVALYQIAKSGGTQTGKGLAVLGLLLSLGFAGYVGYLSLRATRQVASDRAAIERIIAQLATTVQQGEFDKSYALFSPRFQERVAQERFAETMRFVRDGSYGKLQSITTNGRYSFDSDAATGVRVAQAILLIKLEKPNDHSRQEAAFRFVGGQWKFENIPGFFPAPNQ